jgi:hypothetical protein
MLTPHRLVDLFFASHQLYVLVLVLLIKNGELNPHMRKARLLPLPKIFMLGPN